jgi:muramoyltetrapeptide carboxypeptidase
MIRDSEIKMILFSQGGCAANHLLDRIDYALIRENPKIISGISDGTTLLNPIFQRAGLITFHGPDLLWTFGRDFTSRVLANTLDTFCGNPIGRLTPDPDWKPMSGSRHPYGGWKCIRPGKATGPLVGGHLASLINIGFGGYGIDFAGKILFIEGTETDIAFLDKALNALRLKRVFHEIAGLVVGWFDNIEARTEQARTVADLVAEVTEDSKCPVLEIGELGHNVQNYVLPIGCQATLDSGELYLSIDEIPVS